MPVPVNWESSMPLNKDALEPLYARFNDRARVHPDPIEFLYGYDDPADREVAGFVASALAYGRVAQILKSVAAVLDRMTPHPAAFVEQSSGAELRQTFADFRHRFSGGDELAALLVGLGALRRKSGSLNACFAAAFRGDLPAAMSAFANELRTAADGPLGHLLPSPEKNAACKRLYLFLRWMVRHDNVDPGGWTDIEPSHLIIPLDTHMHRIGLELGLTGRRQADLRTAQEITESFRRFAPQDPVRYDFALTRLAITSPLELAEFLVEYRHG